MNYQRKTVLMLFVCSILLLPTAVFAEDGKAIFVIGKVEIINVDGEKSTLKRGSEINSGDIIITSNKGQAQIKMIDGTLLAVRPDSEFKVSDYQYDKNIETDKSVYNLVKGGFRSITGKMGKAKKSSYAVKTVVGTIGIRGTDFSARLCESNCGEQDNGLYVGVMQGGVTLKNDSGSLDVSPGDFGFMPETGIEPSFLNEMPGDLLFAKSNKENANDESALASNTTTPSKEDSQTDTGVVDIAALNAEELAVLDIEPLIDTQPENIPQTDPDPIATIEPDTFLPTIGAASYLVESDILSLDTNVAAGDINYDTTDLTVNFSNSNVDVNYTFKNVVSGNMPTPESWAASNVEPMSFDLAGNFSGTLTGTGAPLFGTRDLTGVTAGNLWGDATPTTIAVPVNPTTSYTVTDSSNIIAGTVTFVCTTGC